MFYIVVILTINCNNFTNINTVAGRKISTKSECME